MPNIKAIVLWALSLACISLAVAAAVVRLCNDFVAPTLPPTQELFAGDTLRVPLRINQKTAAEFVDALSKHKGQIRRIEARGFGGESEPGATIVKAIRSTGLKAVVPEGKGCVSTCVGVLVESGSTEVADQGYVLFHAGRIRSRNDAASCLVCRIASTVIDAVVGPFTPTSTISAMDIWAEAFSPELPAFFESCTINPLTTEEGMALSGEQLKAIAAGTSPTCDALSKQTFSWLQNFLARR